MKNIGGKVKLNDLTKKTPWNMKDFTILKELNNDIAHEKKNFEYVITNKNGTEIYEWPSYVEKKVKKIPYGTKIEVKSYRYNNPDNNNNEGYHEEQLYLDWTYVTYDGVSGWVPSNDIGYKNLNDNYSLISTYRGAKIYETSEDAWMASSNITTNNKPKEIGIIPANTVIENYYIIKSSYKFSNIHLKYNGQWGWIAPAYAPEYNEETVIFVYENDLHRIVLDVDYIFVGLNNKLSIIPKGTEIYEDYCNEYDNDVANLLFVNYNGDKGWAIEVNRYDLNDNEYKEKFNKIYNEIDEYLKNKKDTKTETNNIEINQEANKNTDIINKNIELENNNQSVSDSNNTATQISQNSANQMVTICVIIAASVTIVGLIILVLLNKRKQI